mmetsp:Transcript_10707/g.28418  ORF Transcript_10707/g.28418 Transcript_10707/m.28418 type:complete len:203 (-) Transcript_10707:926-1534(-)
MSSSLESRTTPTVLTCWCSVRSATTRCEGWKLEPLPYSRRRAVTNWSRSRSMAPWMTAMSMRGGSFLLAFALATSTLWLCLWNSRTQDTKLSIRGRPWLSVTVRSEGLETSELRSSWTSPVNVVCTNSSKNLCSPASTGPGMFLATSSPLRRCGLSWLWSLTEPSSRSVKKGSWNMFCFLLPLRADGSLNSRLLSLAPLLTL